MGEYNEKVKEIIELSNRNTEEKLSEIHEDIEALDDRIDELQLFKFPNAIIHGEPVINNGQISGFSATNYLAFPFLVDFGAREFIINMAFTTGSDVTTQQNIIDGKFGLAIAIQDGKFVMAISTNGTSWDLGATAGTHDVKPNTNYYVRLIFNRLQYKLSYSLDKVNYIDDIMRVSTQRPYPVQIYIGVGDLDTEDPKPFGGIINMNDSNVYVSGTLIWQGMDDVGLATRLATDLENIDELGIERINTIISDYYAVNLKKRIDDIEAIAKGRATGYVFDTKEDMDTWLEDPDNVAKLNLGDNLYIRATDTPDYWWDGTTASELETQKVDLEGYFKTEDISTEMLEEPTDETVPSEKLFQAELDKKINTDQDAADSGKALVVGPDGKVIPEKIEVDKSWSGTHDEWEELSLEEKAKYRFVYFTDDTDEPESIINDDVVSTEKTWSSSKINADLGELSDDVAYKVTFVNKIRQSVYAKLGETNNIPAGYLRQGNKPKKMVVLGNSITQHGYREADGIEWTVSDYREMAATRPTSGWVSQVYKYLHDNVNEDLICHKSNASVWEVMPNGSKDFNVILDQKCCLVDTDGPHFDENLTVNDILTEDVDIIIIQLSENIASPTNDAETQTLSSDYTNFYKALFERCPKAKMYQLSPFWKDRNKMLAMAGACQNSNVTCIQLLNGTEADWWVENNHASVQSSVGTQIYDANGNVVATVSAAVAGHPGDVGFNVMATYVVNSLFNQVGGNGIKVPQFGRHSNVNHPECCDFFNTNGTYTSLGDWEAHYKKWFDYILIPGVYDTTFKTPQGQAVHGVITVTQARNSDPYYTAKSYLEITQVCWALNADFKVSRGIVLAASGTNFRPFVFDNISTINMAAGFTPPESTSDCPVEVSVEDTGKKLHGKPVYRLSCYVMEDFEITNSSWYGLTSIPKGIDYSSFSESGEKGVIEHILEIRYIPYDRSPNKTRDYQGNVLYNNIRVYTSARSPHGSWISIASPTADNQTFYKNDILMFEYTLE